jgi:hypothetical protein
MRTILLRLDASTEFGARRSVAALLLILLAVSVVSTLHAVTKPLWFDEICTVIMCRLPNASVIWEALENGADSNPPAYYLLARLARRFVSDDHLGYRLPSILGLLLTVFCIYATLSRRVRHLSALVGAVFLLCTPLAKFAYEARPYAPVVGCISAAILAWQRINDSRLYSIAVAVALALAASFHYYAILVWPAFVLAEASVWIVHRHFRLSAWTALLAGALPALFFSPLLLKLHQYYAQNFWARPSITQVVLDYNWFFNCGHWGWTIAAGVTVMLVYSRITKAEANNGPGQRQVQANVLPIEELTLALTLLWLPVIGVTAAIVAHGGMSTRYIMSTILGGALALGYAIDRVRSAGRALLLVLLLVNYVSFSVGSLTLETRAYATREANAIAAQQRAFDLPVVISDGIRYLQVAYYAPADVSRKLFVIADPRAAVASTTYKSDSVDLQLLVLRRYSSLQVEEYPGFVSSHPEFLLVLGGGEFDWWPARLAHEGYALRIVSAAGGAKIYKVTVRP